MTSPTLEGSAELVKLDTRLPAIFLADAKPSERLWEFFAANIRNRNTRRAYYKAACRFSDWCESRGLFDLAKVKPIHVAVGFSEFSSDCKCYPVCSLM
jgi:hypothetical protein